ncbi:MAG TPA: hypothetical protein VI942_05250 [Thermoanaerobaculia bacterium]|nr:hypothetical protein [Thermoanaerobaculia bacterium]
MIPYAPRPIRFHGVRELVGFRLKDYSIVHRAGTVDWLDFARGFEVVLDQLPRPAVANGRPGVGFRIAHQGDGARYAVLAWWDRENELPLRIAVRRGAEPWRAARADESVCVWDLQVIAAERNAYVETVLAAGAGEAGLRAYLERRFSAD